MSKTIAALISTQAVSPALTVLVAIAVVPNPDKPTSPPDPHVSWRSGHDLRSGECLQFFQLYVFCYERVHERLTRPPDLPVGIWQIWRSCHPAGPPALTRAGAPALAASDWCGGEWPEPVLLGPRPPHQRLRSWCRTTARPDHVHQYERGRRTRLASAKPSRLRFDRFEHS